jgi:hypothetical protein
LRAKELAEYAMRRLLAIDLGLRTGLASYGESGRLLAYRSKHFANRALLRRAAPGIVADVEGLALLVMEGDATLAAIWQRVALRRGVAVSVVSAETWRRDLLLPREQQSGEAAKAHADILARRIIAWSEAPAPHSLRHDAAEAILIGMWGVLKAGWLTELPAAVRRR